MNRRVIGCTLLLATGTAHAQTLDERSVDDPRARSFEVELGGDLTFLTRKVRSDGGDDVGYTTPTYRGFHAAPRYRVDERWAVGVVGAFQWSPEVIHQTRSSMWHFLAEGRFHAFTSLTSPWVGGLVGASTRIISPEGAASEAHSAASVGMEFGNDVNIGQRFAINAIVRGLYTAFGDENDGRGVWMWAGFGVEWRPVVLPRSQRHTVALHLD